jgi:hypothetical protein
MMKQIRTHYKGLFFVVLIGLLCVEGVNHEAASYFSSSPINLSLISSGGGLKNITVSCYSCVPWTTDKWAGTLILNGVPATITYGNGGTVALMIGFGYAVPRNGTAACTSQFSTNSSCIYELPNNALPYPVSFEIHKTSTGGVLKATVYLEDGSSYAFEANSGNLTKSFNVSE